MVDLAHEDINLIEMMCAADSVTRQRGRERDYSLIVDGEVVLSLAVCYTLSGFASFSGGDKALGCCQWYADS